MSEINRHCHKCGWEYGLKGNPGRSESCHECSNDLRVCLNCASYDKQVAHQCRERRAEPVDEKHVGNFCEYFEFIRREFVAAGKEHSREAQARESFNKLFGD